MAMRRNGILTLREGGDAFSKRYDWPGEEIGAVRPYIESLPGLAPTPVDERLARSQEMGRLQLGLALAARGFGSMGAQPRAGEMAISTVGRELLAPLAGDAMTVAQKLYDDKLALQAAFKAEQGKVSLAALDMARDRQNKLAAFEEAQKIAEIKAATTGLLSTLEKNVDFIVEGPDGTELKATGHVNTTRNKLGNLQSQVTFGESRTPDGVVIPAGTRVISFAKPPTGESGSLFFSPTTKEVAITPQTFEYLQGTQYEIPENMIGEAATLSIRHPKSGEDPTLSLIIGGSPIPLDSLMGADEELLDATQLSQITKPWIAPTGPDESGSLSWQKIGLGDLPAVEFSIAGPGAAANVSGLKVVPENLIPFLEGDMWHRDPQRVLEHFPLKRNDEVPLKDTEKLYILDQLRSDIDARKRHRESIGDQMNEDHVYAALEHFLKKTVTQHGLTSAIDTTLGRPTKGSIKVKEEAAIESFKKGANPTLTWNNLRDNGFIPYQHFFRTDAGKSYALSEYSPRIASANNINDPMSIQERQDAGKGLRTMVLDAAAPPQERAVAIAKEAKEVRRERMDVQTRNYASDTRTLLSQALEVNRMLDSFDTAAMLNPGAEGWFQGKFANVWVRLGLQELPGWSELSVAHTVLQEGIARRLGKEGFGEIRITDRDLVGFKEFQAKMDAPHAFNRAALNNMRKLNNRVIKELTREAGNVDYGDALLEEVALSGLDTTKIRPHLNWYNPYFKSNFHLSGQPTPQHSKEYMTALKQIGHLNSLADQDGDLFIPEDPRTATHEELAKDKETKEDDGIFQTYPVFLLKLMFEKGDYEGIQKKYLATIPWYERVIERKFD